MLPSLLSSCVIIESPDDPDSPEAFVRYSNQFSIAYFKKIFHISQNVFCSPLLVRLAMTIFYQISGEAVDEDLRTFLRLPQNKETALNQQKELLAALQESGALKIHSMICPVHNRTLDPTFQNYLQEQQNMSVEPVNYADKDMTSHVINTWIRSKNCRINEFFRQRDPWPITAQNQLSMFSAMSLMTTLKTRFNRDRTIPVDFTFYNNAQTIPQMRGVFWVRYCSDVELKCKVVEIPFEASSGFNLLLIHPTYDALLRNVVPSLSLDYLNHIDAALTDHWVDIRMPLLRLQSMNVVEDAMTKLNFSGLFDVNDVKAFTEGRDRLNHLFQCCQFSLDETGTEPTPSDLQVPDYTFHTERAFMYMVRRNIDGTIVMIGNYSVDHDMIEYL